MPNMLDQSILDYLRRIDANVDQLVSDVRDLGRGVDALEMRVVALRCAFGPLRDRHSGQSSSLDRIEACLSRIERRLSLEATP